MDKLNKQGPVDWESARKTTQYKFNLRANGESWQVCLAVEVFPFARLTLFVLWLP